MNKAHQIAQKYFSPRYRTLDNLERYVFGKQYEGKPHFIMSDKPLFERAPLICDPIVKNAIGSHVDFVLGEGRFPKLTTFKQEDDTDFDDAALNEDESGTLDRFVTELIKQTRLQSVAREQLFEAESSRTAVVILAVNRGKFSCTPVKAKWCTPTFKLDGSLESLEIFYPYIITEFNTVEKKYEEKCMLYKRVLDATRDVTFKTIEAPEDSTVKITWVEDPKRTVKHDLGFCPAIWYAFNSSCNTVATIDGNAVHEDDLEEIDALNFSYSTYYRAALYSGDPQIVEIGVNEGFSPAPAGRKADPGIATLRASDGSTFTTFGPEHRTRGLARKKGIGVVWAYPDPTTKVEMLTLPGDALVSISENLKDLRSKVSESLAYVSINMQDLKAKLGDLSGVALGFLFSRELSWCDTVRLDFGDRWLLPVVEMLLRVALVVGSRNVNGLRIAGIKKVLPILKKFEAVEVEDETGAETPMFMPPAFDLVWGNYFPSTATDDKTNVDLATAAFNGGIIPHEMALEKVSTVFPMQNVQAVKDTVDKEKIENQKQAVQNASDLSKASGKNQPPPVNAK